MTSGPYSSLMRMIRRLAVPRAAAVPGDGDLLQRFASSRDEEAFAALVRRHGPMVLAVCQSVLNHPDDAEDAFQATFIVLVRKARAIGKPQSVGSWLHGVAHRVSLKARAALSRRRVQERQVPPMPNPEADTDTLWRDLRPVLHEEVERLPARYREPFVLCYLEGKTNDEAAAILGWPKGTVLSSLSRARERLRERLTRRGLTLSAAALTTVLAEKAAAAAVAPALVDATVRVGVLYASGSVAGIAAPVLAYADALTRSMFFAKLQLALVALVACGALGGGSALLLMSLQANQPPPAAAEAPPAPRLDAPPAPAVPPPPPRVVVPDADRIQGTWVVVTGEQHGAAFKELIDTRLVLTRDDFILTAPRGEVRWIIRRGETRGAWRLDQESKPGQLTLQEKTRSLQAIYRLEDDRLTLCMGDPDVRDRPAGFATTPDDRRLLLVFQRQRETLAPPAER